MIMTARRRVAFFSLVLTALMASFGALTPASAQIPFANLLWSEPRYAAIVVDAASGEVLYSRNPDSPRYPASITKVMTLYLAFEALQAGRLSLSDTVAISPQAAAMPPTKLGLRPGDTITVDETLRAVSVKSANDMAVALAEKISGSESRFATLMTLRARELGMSNTRFVNASGLPDSRQVSSARDIAILARSVMRDFPQYYAYFGQRQFAFRGQIMNNHNHLLDSMPGVDGLKTGYTNASGFNLAASAVQNGRRLITVVLGGSSTAARDANVQDLLTTGFNVLRRRDRGEDITIAQNLFEPDPTGPIQRAPVEQGDADQKGLRIVMDDDLTAPGGARSGTDVATPEVFTAVQAKVCGPVQVVRYVKRKGRRVKVVNSVYQCKTGGVAQASAQKVCTKVRLKAKKGRKARIVTRCREASVTEARSAASAQLVKASTVSRASGGWAIQVGAFKRKADADRELNRIGRRFSNLVGEADPDVGRLSSGVYRARFLGFTASDARTACASLKAQRQRCIAMAYR
jgi:D-alanyl-D-alanine carboxypeptidase (penicillin-binding protein 5/6)